MTQLGNLTCEWTAATVPTNAKPITGYIVTAHGDDSSIIVSETLANDATSYEFTNVVEGTSYTFTVVAINADGSSPDSMASSSVFPDPAPPAPTNVAMDTFTANGQGLTVHWDQPSLGAGETLDHWLVQVWQTSTEGVGQDSVVLQAITVPDATVGTGFSQVVTGLTVGDTVDASVTAVGSGQGISSHTTSHLLQAAASGTVTPTDRPSYWTTQENQEGHTGTLCNPVLQLAYSGIDTSTVTSVALNVENPSVGSGTTYTVWTGSGNPPTFVNFPMDYGETATVTYSVGNATGVGGESPGLSVTAPSTSSNVVPPPVTDPAVSLGDDSVSGVFTWYTPTDQVGNPLTDVTSYNIYSIALGDYSLEYSGAGTDNGGNQYTATVESLDADTTYTFAITAVNEAGESLYSSQVTLSTSATGTPDSVAPVSIYGNGAGSVVVSWQVPDTGTPQGYHVYDTTTTRTLLATVDPANQYYIVNDYSDGTYDFVVTAFSGDNESADATAEWTFTPLPDAPGDLTADTSTANQVTLSWTAPDGHGSDIAFYNVGRTDWLAEDYGNPYSYLTGVTDGSTSCVVEHVDGTAHFVVSATNEQGEGPVATITVTVTNSGLISGDDPSSPVVLPTDTATHTYTWDSTTVTDDVASVDSFEIYYGRWFSFTAPANGTLLLDMRDTSSPSNSNTDTRVSVYLSVPTDSDSTPDAFDDDSGGPNGGASLSSYLLYDVTSGDTYYICAGGDSPEDIDSIVLATTFTAS